ncbi:MAG: tRNA (adenosine(37)-N6)-dimethylallyltransferase MiaA [Oscillospiraceae bacterium]|nr:tRNA (adenosine(37)-N6)-dimethylallyltransferase MiaA [Oscillospiraceae bacterium]
MKKVICVAGPTASGKSALSVKLAKALDAEIVSCDSMQIYRRMDVGTAKPTAAEMEGIPHHLIDYVEPDEAYSVSRYVQDASKCVDGIHEKGKNVIITGGTGLYMDSLVKGLYFSQRGEDDIIRKRLDLMYLRYGAERMHKLLAKRDADAADRIHPNDKRRVLRALEVSFLSPGISRHNAVTREIPARYDALYLGIDFRDRAKLYERIDRRVELMLAGGLLSEARELAGRYDRSLTALQAIGYKELFDCLDEPEKLKTAAEKLKQSTRRYAKRQLTWLRRNEAIKWLYPDEAGEEEIIRISTECARSFLYNR